MFFVEDVCPVFDGETSAFPGLEEVEEGFFTFDVAEVGLIDVVDGGRCRVLPFDLAGVCEGVFHEGDDSGRGVFAELFFILVMNAGFSFGDVDFVVRHRVLRGRLGVFS